MNPEWRLQIYATLAVAGHKAILPDASLPDFGRSRVIKIRSFVQQPVVSRLAAMREGGDTDASSSGGGRARTRGVEAVRHLSICIDARGGVVIRARLLIGPEIEKFVRASWRGASRRQKSVRLECGFLFCTCRNRAWSDIFAGSHPRRNTSDETGLKDRSPWVGGCPCPQALRLGSSRNLPAGRRLCFRLVAGRRFPLARTASPLSDCGAVS
jgi:hypothetical protein